MDEPFAALDAQTREGLQDELLRIWEKARTTILFITHGIDEAVYLGQRVAVMTSRPGRIKCVVEIPPDFRQRQEDVRSTAEFGELRHVVRSHPPADDLGGTEAQTGPLVPTGQADGTRQDVGVAQAQRCRMSTAPLSSIDCELVRCRVAVLGAEHGHGQRCERVGEC